MALGSVQVKAEDLRELIQGPLGRLYVGNITPRQRQGRDPEHRRGALTSRIQPKEEHGRAEGFRDQTHDLLATGQSPRQQNATLRPHQPGPRRSAGASAGATDCCWGMNTQVPPPTRNALDPASPPAGSPEPPLVR